MVPKCQTAYFVTPCFQEEIKLGGWVAVDYGNGVLYVGKVTLLDGERAEAAFLSKIDVNRYKERENRQRSIDSFLTKQVLKAELKLDLKKNGIAILHNYDELRKLLEKKK